MDGRFSTTPESNGHGCGESPIDSRWPNTTQLCVMGSRLISMRDSLAKPAACAQFWALDDKAKPLEHRCAAHLFFCWSRRVVSLALRELSSKRVVCSRTMDIDAGFMEQALEEARASATAGEVPIGAILVQDGKIVARSGGCGGARFLQRLLHKSGVD